MKYIILDDNGMDVPIIFPVFWHHDRVAGRFSQEVISAGFLKRNDKGELYTSGKSISLNVSSREEDLDIILSNLDFEM